MQPSLMRVMAGLVLLIASAPAGLAADPPAGTVRYAGFDVAFDGGTSPPAWMSPSDRRA